MASLRLGVVLAFDGEVRSEIDGLRRAISSPQLSIVEPHITLSSPTNIDSTRLVPLLLSLFGKVNNLSPIEVEIGPAGSFRVDKFVSLLRVETGFDLQSLSERIRGEFGLGLPPYPFVPHVTLYDGATEEIVEGAEQLLRSYRRRYWFDSIVVLRMNKKGAYARFAEPLFTTEFRSSNGGFVTRYFLLRGVGDLLSQIFEDDFYGNHVGGFGAHIAIETAVEESFTILGFDDQEIPSAFVTLRQTGAVVVVERIFVAEAKRGQGVSRGALKAVAFYMVKRGVRYLEAPIVECDERLVSVLTSLGAKIVSRDGDLYSDRYSLNLLNL